MYIIKYIYIYIYIYIYVYIYIQTYKNIYTYVYIYTNVYVYIYMFCFFLSCVFRALRSIDSGSIYESKRHTVYKEDIWKTAALSSSA